VAMKQKSKSSGLTHIFEFDSIDDDAFGLLSPYSL
jgi:hypothetical protein